jgi:hypothetical protein
MASHWTIESLLVAWFASAESGGLASFQKPGKEAVVFWRVTPAWFYTKAWGGLLLNLETGVVCRPKSKRKAAAVVRSMSPKWRLFETTAARIAERLS